eukprot:3931814-Rhodomonas_salina.1
MNSPELCPRMPGGISVPDAAPSQAFEPSEAGGAMLGSADPCAATPDASDLAFFSAFWRSTVRSSMSATCEPVSSRKLLQISSGVAPCSAPGACRISHLNAKTVFSVVSWSFAAVNALGRIPKPQ